MFFPCVTLPPNCCVHLPLVLPHTPDFVSVVALTQLAIYSFAWEFAKLVIGELFLHIPWRSATNLCCSSLWKLKATQ